MTLAANEQRTLGAGSYGALTANAGNGGGVTRLQLSGGEYRFSSVSIGTDARLECSSACELRVDGRVLVGARSYLGPASVQGLGPGNVQLLVRGSNAGNGPSGTPASMTMDNDSQLRAYALAPNGTLRVGQRVTLRGKFVAKDALIGIDSNGQGQQLPVITEQPVGDEIWEHQNYTFSVQATGPNISYRWRKNGVNITGATNSTYPITNARVSDGGTYTVALTTNAGTVVSNPAGLTVIPCQATDATCDGIDEDCSGEPDDDFVPYCDGAARFWCEDEHLSSTSCSNGVLCDGEEQCSAGQCVTGPVTGLDDGNRCTIDECEETGGVTHRDAIEGSSCDDGNDGNGYEVCNADALCVMLPRIEVLRPAYGKFVPRHVEIEGVLRGTGITSVEVAGVSLTIEGDRFRGALDFESDGRRGLSVIASGPSGTVGTDFIEFVVDSTPLSLVTRAHTIPDKPVVGPPNSNNALQQFVFELAEPIEPSSFDPGANLSIEMDAVFATGRVELPVAEAISNVTISADGRAITVEVDPSVVHPGATYWVEFDTTGLILAGSGALIGEQERPEISVARVSVVPQGERAPSIVARVPANEASYVQPHSRVSLVFSEAMRNVDYVLSAAGSTSLSATRVALGHRLGQSREGLPLSILSGTSRTGLRLDTEHALAVHASDTIDLGGVSLQDGMQWAFRTSGLRIDLNQADQMQFPAVVRGFVVTSVEDDVLVKLADERGNSIGPVVQATRSADVLSDAGVAVHAWQAILDGPLGQAVEVYAWAGVHTDAVEVLGSAQNLLLPPVSINPNDVVSRQPGVLRHCRARSGRRGQSSAHLSRLRS